MLKIFLLFVSLILTSVIFAPTTYATNPLINFNESHSAVMTQTTKINDILLNANQPSQNKDTSTLINYPDVNQYIIQNNINHSNVIKDSRMNTLPKLPYKYGTYKGVVIHEVGEDNRTLQQWVDRMYDTYNTAFVHAFVDNKEIHLTAPSEYYVWGAGKATNPYFYQIEVVRAYTFDDFARSVNNQAWLATYMLKQNGLTPSFADKNKGIGTIISHNAVRQYWGGTTHVGTIAYYGKWGYDMQQFFELVTYHYNHM